MAPNIRITLEQFNAEFHEQTKLCPECGWPEDNTQVWCKSGVSSCNRTGVLHGHGSGHECHACHNYYAYHSDFGKFPGMNPDSGMLIDHPDRILEQKKMAEYLRTRKGGDKDAVSTPKA